MRIISANIRKKSHISSPFVQLFLRHGAKGIKKLCPATEIRPSDHKNIKRKSVPGHANESGELLRRRVVVFYLAVGSYKHRPVYIVEIIS